MAYILFSDVSAGYDGITADDLPPDQLMVCAERRRYKRGTEVTGAAGRRAAKARKAGVSGRCTSLRQPLGFNQQRDLHQLPSLPAGN